MPIKYDLGKRPVSDPIKLFFLCFPIFAVKFECLLHKEKPIHQLCVKRNNPCL